MKNVIFGVHDKKAMYVIMKNIKKFIDSEDNIKRHYKDIIAITDYKDNKITMHLINADEIKLKIEYDMFII